MHYQLVHRSEHLFTVDNHTGKLLDPWVVSLVYMVSQTPISRKLLVAALVIARKSIARMPNSGVVCEADLSGQPFAA